MHGMNSATGAMVAPTRPARQAGVLDRAIAIPENLPGPALLWCGVFFGVMLIVPHAILWAVGVLPAGQWLSYIWLPAAVSGSVVMFVTVLDETARHALSDFEPALGQGSDTADIARQLTSVPDRIGLAVIVAVEIFATIGYLGDPATAADVFSRSTVETWTFLIVSWISIGLTGLFVAHSVLQLRAIARLHREAKHVDLFHAAPAHAFARVTALTGVAFLVLGVFVLGDPTAVRETAFYALEGLLVISFAAAAFALPLRGMNNRLSAEKVRLINAANERIKATTARIHISVDADDLSRSAELNASLSSLIAERDLIARLSTWPWSTTTFRTFGSALLLPIVIWVVTRILERVGV
jgi:hypothetical protein